MPWIGDENACIYLSKKYFTGNIYFYNFCFTGIVYYKGGIRYKDSISNNYTYVYVEQPIIMKGSIGSDPHVYTIFGEKYDLEPSSRRWYNIFRYDEIEINGHFSAIGKGIFFNKVNIKEKNDDVIKINFNKKRISNEVKKKWIDVRYKEDGVIIENRRIMDVLEIEHKEIEMEIYVDFYTRYLHFIIRNIKNKWKCKGLIVEKE